MGVSGVCLRLRASALERAAASQGRADGLHKDGTGEERAPVLLTQFRCFVCVCVE